MADEDDRGGDIGIADEAEASGIDESEAWLQGRAARWSARDRSRSAIDEHLWLLHHPCEGRFAPQSRRIVQRREIRSRWWARHRPERCQETVDGDLAVVNAAIADRDGLSDAHHWQAECRRTSATDRAGWWPGHEGHCNDRDSRCCGN